MTPDFYQPPPDPRKTPNFNTGKKNWDRNKRILDKMIKEFYNAGYHTIQCYQDKKSRIFAYKLKDPQGYYFILVARSTKPFAKEYFGTQTWVVREARDKRIPLVLAVCPDNEPRQLYLFNPDIMLKFMKGENERLGEKMGNFSIKDGWDWNPDKIAISLMREKVGLNKKKDEGYVDGVALMRESEKKLKERLRNRGRKRRPTDHELGHRDKKTLRRKTALEKQRIAQTPFVKKDKKHQSKLGEY